MATDDLEDRLNTQEAHKRIAEIEAADEERSREVPTEQELPQPDETKKPKPKLNHKKKLIIWGAASVIALLLIAWFVSPARYAMLNVVGMRTQLVVIGGEQGADDAKQVKVKRFQVVMDGQTFDAGDSHELTIKGRTFGNHKVEVRKNGYESFTQDITLDFDPFFGAFGKDVEADRLSAKLKATGVSITFMARDWLSNTPIAKGEFISHDRTTEPDENGQVTIVVPPTDAPKITVEAKFKDTYLSKAFELEQNKKDQVVTFVPSNKHYFVSKRTGVYSVYSSYADGSKVEEVVKGTDQETQSLIFAVSPSGKYAVMASTRDGTRDEEGNVLQKIYWVDLKDGKLEELDRGLFVNFYDWSGDTLAYTYTYKEPKTTTFQQRLRTIDVFTHNRNQIAITNGFIGQVNVAGGKILYTQQDAAGGPEVPTLVLKSSGMQGDAKRDLAGSILQLRQLDFERFAYQTSDHKWNELHVSTGQVKSISAPGESSKVFLNSQSSNKQQVAIDTIDGKQVLLVRASDGTEKKVATAGGLGGPIRWLNDTTIVYRVVNSSETADYVVSTLGGESHKITDVTATGFGGPQYFRYF